MATEGKSLTQATLDDNFRYRETWEVYVSNQREPYILDEVEFAILKEEVARGSKGTVMFEKFGINLTYFVSYFRRSRSLKRQFHLAEQTEYKEPTPEQHAKSQKILDEMRKKLGVKLSKK